MSGDPQIDPDVPPTEGSLLMGTPAEHPPRDGQWADDPITTSERYWRLFNDPGLLPPEGVPSVPSPVSTEAFQDLAHQVRALAGMVQVVIPLISQSVDPSMAPPTRQLGPSASVHVTTSALPSSPWTRAFPLGGQAGENPPGQFEPETISSGPTDFFRVQLRLLNQRLEEV